jgi:uncharacterized protein
MFHTLLAVVALAQPDATKITEAFQAARTGDEAKLADALKAGVGVNDPNARGDTLLTVAAYNGQPKAVAVILKQPKVDVEAKNKLGLTAASAAAFKGHADILTQLIDAKADVNAANEHGQTPLMFAVQSGKVKAVEVLLKAGAKKDTADKEGNTALSLAKKAKADDIVKALEK